MKVSILYILWKQSIRATKMASGLALGIPENLAAALSNLKVNTTGEPVWNSKKQKSSFSVHIFWRTARQSCDVPFNAHRGPTNRRKQRSRLRMEAFLDRKKKACTEQGKQDHLSASNQQPGVPVNHAEITIKV